MIAMWLQEAVERLTKDDPTLVSLHLSCRDLEYVDVRGIADALRENSTRQTLKLGGNGIGDAGAQAIADALRENSTLQTLELRENGIRGAGAQAIADALYSSRRGVQTVPRPSRICYVFI